jgi:hypothetical protein
VVDTSIPADAAANILPMRRTKVNNLCMNTGDRRYIWQRDDWPGWRFDVAALATPMVQVGRSQGLLMGRLADVGMALRDQASLAALTDDVAKTSAIEGETLDADSVRSSIARRLGVAIGALAPADQHVEGVVDMVLEQPHASMHQSRQSGCSAGMRRCSRQASAD